MQIAIPSGGETRARSFYGTLLGLPELPKPPRLARRGGLWFRVGAAELHLGIDPGFRPVWKVHPAFSVEDLPALRRRMIDRGAEVFDDLPLPGFRRFYARDPFGNRLEFVEPRSRSRSRASPTASSSSPTA